MNNSPSDNNVPNTEQGASSVSLKIPVFWSADPELWFIQVECQFTSRGITNELTKFQHIVANLPPEIAMEVRDFLVTPPAEQPFTKLKEMLVRRTTISEQQRLKQLLSQETISDQKPTQVLRRMHQLLGNNSQLLDDSIFREMFLQRLPSSVQMVLAAADKGSSVQTLAELADKVMEVSQQNVPITAVHKGQDTELANIRQDIASLKQSMEQLSFHMDKLINYQPKHRSFSRGRSKSRNGRNSEMCFYHERFGEKAKHCLKPCNYKSN